MRQVASDWVKLSQAGFGCRWWVRLSNFCSASGDSDCVSLGQAVSGWVKLRRVRSDCVRLGQTTSGWVRLGQVGPYRIMQAASGWLAQRQVGSGCTRLHQFGSYCIRLRQVGSGCVSLGQAATWWEGVHQDASVRSVYTSDWISQIAQCTVYS